MRSNAPEFGIMFFSASEESLLTDKYRLVIEAARFADRHDFSSVWVPERHFANLGGLYPNPAVLQAAIALATTRVALRAGSVVLPLHDPVRVAEEWSMVDNLSGGRVGISFAPGWNPEDFVFFPDRYAKRQDEMFAAIPTVQRLWRGEAYSARAGHGRPVEVRVLPRPIQRELPTWITAARTPETFVRAGEIGANVLTHLLDQDVDGVASKVALYREARARAGFDPATGIVSLMVHTFLGADASVAREAAREPYCAFLKSNASLLKGLATSRGEKVDLDAFSEQEKDAFVNFLYDRFVGSRALIGSAESCRDLAIGLWQAGVDEIACLLDFGPSYDAVLASLPELDRLRSVCTREAATTSRRRSGVGDVREAPIARAVRAPEQDSLDAIRSRCEAPSSGEAFYADLERRGLVVEGDLRAVQQVWRRDGEALGEVEAKREARPGASIAPTDLDACLQIASAAVSRAGADSLCAPVGYRSLEILSAANGRLWSHAVARSRAGDNWEADVRILNGEGTLVATVGGVSFHRVEAPRHEIEPWLYRLEWQRSGLDENAALSHGRWVILADRGGVGAHLQAELQAQGTRSIVIRREDVFADGVSDEDALARLASELEQVLDAGVGVLHLWSLDAPASDAMPLEGLDESQSWGSAAALRVVQSLLAKSGVKAGRLWVVTRAAQSVTGVEQISLAQSPVWGLGRTCAMEHPEVWGGLIDLDPQASAEEAAISVRRVLASSDGEDQVAFRDGERYTVRLSRASAPREKPVRIDPEAAYLVTGGLWGLGLEVARWLAQRGARHLVLLGRTDLPPRDSWGDAGTASDLRGRIAAVRELEALGAKVHYAATDVADPRAMSNLLSELQRRGTPAVRGVVHAASVWRGRDGQSLIRTLAQLDLGALKQVFAPKVLGSWVLHETFPDLDFFVLFSSAASLTGSAGQGNYAAASSFLDALAQHRIQAGKSALCVNWGPISGAGFGATPEGQKVHRYWEDNGLKRIDPSSVLRALELLIPNEIAQIGVMNIDWAALGSFFPGLARARWASNVFTSSAPRAQASELLVALRAAPAAGRRDLLRGYVQNEVRRVMGLDGPPDPRRRLFDMGMDSLMALDMKKRLQDELAADVPVTAVFNYPTIDALVGYLITDVLAFEADDQVVPVRAASNDPSDALAGIRDLSDEEAERRLADRLARGGARP
jgi:phthiocerol/phenolphthiocerol synthesis type-I polyketide synthase D